MAKRKKPRSPGSGRSGSNSGSPSGSGSGRGGDGPKKGGAPKKRAAASPAGKPAGPGAQGSAPSAPSAQRAGAWGFALEMSLAKFAVARFAIFAVLAVDAVLQIGHASRYGAGEFNVAHLPFLPGLSRLAYLHSQCLIACLAMLVAVGAGGRLPAIALSLVYGWCYFGSQLDSYQHHYLVWLLLTLWCFVPTGAALGASAPPIRSSALRLLLLQLAIMYLWAAISKFDAKWLDGTAMSLQIRGLLREVIDDTVGIKIVSRLVIVTELALAATIWRQRAWRWALPLGLGLHCMIALSGLEIGVFAYLMLAIYLLVIPEPMVRAGVGWLRARTAPWSGRVAQGLSTGHRAAAGALSLVALGLLFAVRPPLRSPLVMAFAAAPLLLTARWQLTALHRFTTRAALAATLALLALVVVDRAAGVSLDYYRYWGGTARRLGAPAEAEQAYRGLIEVAPHLELAHYQLGRLLLKRGALEDGLAQLRLAEQLDPGQARASDELARALRGAGREEEAVAAAQRAQARRAATAPSAVPARAGRGEPDDREDETSP